MLNKSIYDGMQTEFMKPQTRLYLIERFGRQNNTFDTHAAAAFFSVTTRTINNWLKTGCPIWVDNYIELIQRAIPSTPEWKDFRFSNDGHELLTPFDNLRFKPSDLLKQFFERQFHRLSETENRKLREQVDTMRNDEETTAIREELDLMIKTITSLKSSPLLTQKGVYAKAVKRETIKK
jgi:hypothetical protein